MGRGDLAKVRSAHDRGRKAAERAAARKAAKKKK